MSSKRFFVASVLSKPPANGNIGSRNLKAKLIVPTSSISTPAGCVSKVEASSCCGNSRNFSQKGAEELEETLKSAQLQIKSMEKLLAEKEEEILALKKTLLHQIVPKSSFSNQNSPSSSSSTTKTSAAKPELEPSSLVKFWRDSMLSRVSSQSQTYGQDIEEILDFHNLHLDEASPSHQTESLAPLKG